MTDTKALIVSRNDELCHSIKASLNRMQVISNTSDVWSNDVINDTQYHYYFIDEEAIGDLEGFVTPSTGYIVCLMKEANFDNYRSWTKKGVTEVLVLPEELAMIEKIIENTLEHVQQGYLQSSATTADNGTGQVISFYSSKGGSGKTLLSTLFAQCINAKFNKKALLIDLNLQYGGVEVLLGLESKRTYYDLQPVIHELSFHHINNILATEEMSGLDVLLSPMQPEKAEQIDDNLISTLIRVSKQHYDYVILDLPSSMNSTSFTGLSESSHIYYVLTPDSLAVRGMKHASDMFERFQIGNRGEVSLVLNKVNKKQEITAKHVQKLVDYPLSGKIRSDFFKLQPSINMGTSMIKKKGFATSSKIVKDIISMINHEYSRVNANVLASKSS